MGQPATIFSSGMPARALAQVRSSLSSACLFNLQVLPACHHDPGFALDRWAFLLYHVTRRRDFEDEGTDGVLDFTFLAR